MTLIDVVQLISVSIAIAAMVIWCVRLRKWPLTLAVVVAMLTNVAFYLSRTFNLFTPQELNLFSSVRVLLMVVIIAVIPFSVERES